MIEVVGVEAFNELKKTVEGLTKAIAETNEHLDELTLEVRGHKNELDVIESRTDEAVADVNRRIDVIEEKSKGVFAKVKEALKFE